MLKDDRWHCTELLMMAEVIEPVYGVLNYVVTFRCYQSQWCLRIVLLSRRVGKLDVKSIRFDNDQNCFNSKLRIELHLVAIVLP
jgi:hypothetical protein